MLIVGSSILSSDSQSDSQSSSLSFLQIAYFYQFKEKCYFWLDLSEINRSSVIALSTITYPLKFVNKKLSDDLGHMNSLPLMILEL
jgi:hypothetical protein